MDVIGGVRSRRAIHTTSLEGERKRKYRPRRRINVNFQPKSAVVGPRKEREGSIEEDDTGVITVAI